jgi:serine/threonine-protein kinase
VTEWANRAAIFTRMVSRAYTTKDAPADVLAALSRSWDLAARASRLEGEVASLTRRLDALERRGRALRAEIGRKVEDLAQEESRAQREASAHGEDVLRAAGEIEQLERGWQAAREEVEGCRRTGRMDCAVFERFGAAAATLEAKRGEHGRYQARNQNCAETAKGLRKQIEQLREQLSRYAEALEEDLAKGRAQVAERTREGIEFEKAFSAASSHLMRALRDKPECRDLMPELFKQGG